MLTTTAPYAKSKLREGDPLALDQQILDDVMSKYSVERMAGVISKVSVIGASHLDTAGQRLVYDSPSEHLVTSGGQLVARGGLAEMAGQLGGSFAIPRAVSGGIGR